MDTAFLFYMDRVNVMTPMLAQYFRVKEENPDCILLFRVGDFFETYGEDAEIFARELEVTLTSKDAGKGKKIAMSGVPFFTLDQYVARLVAKGYRAAVCDQVEDAKQAKGLVRREVVRIVSPGTILDPDNLDGKRNNYFASVLFRDSMAAMAFCDLSTGDFEVTEFAASDELALLEELDRWKPAEILLDPSLTYSRDFHAYLETENIVFRYVNLFPTPPESREFLYAYYDCDEKGELELFSYGLAMHACHVLLQDLTQSQKTSDLSVKRPSFIRKNDFVVVDSVSKKNLELVETLMGRERKGSLLWSMDETVTSMGARLLRSWILKPLMNRASIESRLAAVEELYRDYEALKKIKSCLSRIQDMERLATRVVFGSANARDLISLLGSIRVLPEIKMLLGPFASALLKDISHMEDLQSLAQLLESAINEQPPATVRDGGMIRSGFHEELDELRGIRTSAKEWIARMEERERERTGIKTLKISFNQVFGYYIEITKSNVKMAPDNYIRKQTVANAERYINPELKEYEAKVLGADERIKSLEFELFNSVRLETVKYVPLIRDAADKVAALDVLSGFAHLALEHSYVKPSITEDGRLEIYGGRHPVAQRLIGTAFVKNDLVMDRAQRMIIITGPNMSGKSTYLRQTALIVLMAQTGCFVPADSAEIGIVDKIFTRVGATDDLHLGQSTFMVEMLETSNIINNATENSLVILDEIGRGTSTYDGMSIAWAVVETLYRDVKAKALFATHFHELTELASSNEGIVNKKVAVKEMDDEVIFLHKIMNGAADKSYGLYVAKLAGFPRRVLDRAEELLEQMERKTLVSAPAAEDTAKGQLSFLQDTTHPVIRELRRLDIMEMTPLEALNKIYKWQISAEKIK